MHKYEVEDIYRMLEKGQEKWLEMVDYEHEALQEDIQIDGQSRGESIKIQQKDAS